MILCGLWYIVAVSYSIYPLLHLTPSSHMVAIIAKVVGSLSTAILTYASARNMLETTHITSMVQNEKGSIEKVLQHQFDPLLAQYISKNDCGNLIVCPQGKCSTEILEDLKKMKRKDLLLLFLLCDAPLDEKDIHGDWDGVLLNNNSVLVSNESNLFHPHIDLLTEFILNLILRRHLFLASLPINSLDVSMAIGEERLLETVI